MVVMTEEVIVAEGAHQYSENAKEKERERKCTVNIKSNTQQKKKFK